MAKSEAELLRMRDKIFSAIALLNVGVRELDMALAAIKVKKKSVVKKKKPRRDRHSV